MSNNYTPIDIEKLKGKDDKFSAILMTIALLTLIILAVVLFLLIQKKIKERELIENIENNQTLSPSPYKLISPTLTPEPIFIEEESSTPPSELLENNKLPNDLDSPTKVATESFQENKSDER